jgi:two-component system, OmpR family, osmolarity sensor histidine kinase EnvZ
MEAVIAQFMDYARTNAGEDPVATDLNDLLAAIAERQAQLGRPLEFADAALPSLTVRPRALNRAIGNLIDNARKYSGGEISLAASVHPKEIWIDVRDRGPGIPAGEAERLKRPFTRLDSARSNATGTGLGLAIVDRIARLHNGHLDLLPNPGGGLLARLVIPLGGS